MKEVSLRDVGLDANTLDMEREMQCTNVIETENFHIAVFMLPAGKTIPYHDHPNMVVCSKVISGSLRLQSFSKLSDSSSDLSLDGVTATEDETIQVELDSECTKSSSDDCWMLTPKRGNFHEFTALTPCVILDILLPPYDEPDRLCHFYHAKQEKTNPKRWTLIQIPEDIADETVVLPFMVDYGGHQPVLYS